MADEPRLPGFPPATSTPRTFAETVPPQASMGADYTQFTLTTVMKLQESVGGLVQAVESLTKKADEQGRKVDRMSHVIYAAGAVVSVLTAIAVFILSKLSDVAIEALKKGLTHP